MTEGLEFDSKPFTTLIRRLYLLFRSLRKHYKAQDRKKTPKNIVKEEVRKLENCAEIERLLKVALNTRGWPVVCDKVKDQYPSTTILTDRQKDALSTSYVNRSVGPSGMSSGVKRKREEEDAPPVFTEVKRPKISPPLWKRIWTMFTG